MRWVWTVIALAGMPACFYVDPINERPSADIDQVNPELPYRGDPITVTPHIVEPDHDTTTVEWRAYACSDDGCDNIDYDSATTEVFSVEAPKTTLNGHLPATGVHIELDVADEWGAQAQPTQTLDLPLGDRDPEIDAHADSLYRLPDLTFPTEVPVQLYVTASDADDNGGLTFEDAVLYPPEGLTLSDGTLTRMDAGDTDNAGLWELVAHQPGDWSVGFEVRDPLDVDSDPQAHHRAAVTLPVPVVGNLEPCIGLTDPTFTPPGARIIVDSLRHFSVATVDDDRDPYPADPDKPLNGTATFRWYLDGQQLNVDGNYVEIDPSLYTPGTQLSLRVEAVDRADQPLCDSALDTCEDRPGCFQRETWYLEAR